ncbi:hypothetical protein ACL07V_17265 [Streptomyces sp. MB22_4]|uniref:hypothetical protein n=1 Tax=Streptomyces sp. MB22_4 TaxID=3383120 RepID=UPI0039A0F97F
MRPLPVPVRLVATALAVTAAAGCVNVADPGSRATPSHAARRHGADGAAAGAGPAADGVGGPGRIAPEGDGGHEHGGKREPGESAPASPSGASGADSASAAPAGPRKSPGAPPAPPRDQPTPGPTSAPPPPPATTPPPPGTEPPSAEPSSSAHEDPGPQLVQREPAPAAGVPM